MQAVSLLSFIFPLYVLFTLPTNFIAVGFHCSILIESN